ncbi:hypothetical protein K8R42_01380 [bacterium]|nr:hypothetical protein [bacterium]
MAKYYLGMNEIIALIGKRVDDVDKWWRIKKDAIDTVEVEPNPESHDPRAGGHFEEHLSVEDEHPFPIIRGMFGKKVADQSLTAAVYMAIEPAADEWMQLEVAEEMAEIIAGEFGQYALEQLRIYFMGTDVFHDPVFRRVVMNAIPPEVLQILQESYRKHKSSDLPIE